MRDREASTPPSRPTPCPGCKQPMRLAGRESHPTAPNIDLLTFQCVCGQVFTVPSSRGRQLHGSEYSALDRHWNAGSQFASFSLVALPQADALSKTLPIADDYRKRAAAIGKRLKHVKSDKKHGLGLLRRKQQALLALADNEDWLAGKSKYLMPKSTVRRRLRPASSV